MVHCNIYKIAAGSVVLLNALCDRNLFDFNTTIRRQALDQRRTIFIGTDDHRIRFTATLRLQTIGGNTFADQIIFDRARAPFRQGLVILHRANPVRVAGDNDIAHFGVTIERVGNFIQFELRQRQRGTIEGKQFGC